jgi:alpha-L-fucosidase
VRGEDQHYSPANCLDENKDTYWATDDDVHTGTLELSFPSASRMKYVVLQEYIPLGQRVKSFHIEAWTNNQWTKVAEGTTIGYKRIIRIEPVSTERIRISITNSRACPLISNVELY